MIFMINETIDKVKETLAILSSLLSTLANEEKTSPSIDNIKFPIDKIDKIEKIRPIIEYKL